MATDRTERLLNLVICLLGAHRPVSRAALRESIPGYGDAASDEAFERMFERDKEELRHMGVPIDTVVNVQGEVEGYRIDEDAYAMPPLTLDPAELAVLGLAARTWNAATVAAEAGAALRKIEALTGETWSPPQISATRPGTGEEVLPTLWEALRSRRKVRFTYLARGRDESEVRTVEPWATVHRDGAWYLIGRSVERGAARAFRLSRIDGTVVIESGAAVPGSREEVEAAIASIGDPTPQGSARVRLPQAGAARLKGASRFIGDDVWEVEYADARALIAETIEAGGVLVTPEALADEQRRALRHVVEVHRG